MKGLGQVEVKVHFVPGVMDKFYYIKMLKNRVDESVEKRVYVRIICVLPG